jgi:hypothetical protein
MSNESPSTDITDQLERAINCAFMSNDMNNVAKLLEMKIELLRNRLPTKAESPT